MVGSLKSSTLIWIVIFSNVRWTILNPFINKSIHILNMINYIFQHPYEENSSGSNLVLIYSNIKKNIDKHWTLMNSTFILFLAYYLGSVIPYYAVIIHMQIVTGCVRAWSATIIMDLFRSIVYFLLKVVLQINPFPAKNEHLNGNG